MQRRTMSLASPLYITCPLPHTCMHTHAHLNLSHCIYFLLTLNSHHSHVLVFSAQLSEPWLAPAGEAHPARRGPKNIYPCNKKQYLPPHLQSLLLKLLTWILTPLPRGGVWIPDHMLILPPRTWSSLWYNPHSVLFLFICSHFWAITYSSVMAIWVIFK